MSVSKQSKLGPSVAAALKIAPPARLHHFLATSDCQTPAMLSRFLGGSYKLAQKQMPNAAFSWSKLSLPFLHSKCSTSLELFYLENITVKPSHEKLPKNTSRDVRGNLEAVKIKTNQKSSHPLLRITILLHELLLPSSKVWNFLFPVLFSNNQAGFANQALQQVHQSTGISTLTWGEKGSSKNCWQKGRKHNMAAFPYKKLQPAGMHLLNGLTHLTCLAQSVATGHDFPENS